MADPSLHLLDLATGEKVEATRNVLMERIEDLEIDLANAERDLRNKRSENTRLKNELKRQRTADELRPEVEIVFEHWKRVCKHMRSILDEKRQKACQARIEDGYTVEQMCLAMDGLAFDPNTKPCRNGRLERYDDMELALRSAENLERYANRAPRR